MLNSQDEARIRRRANIQYGNEDASRLAADVRELLRERMTLLRALDILGGVCEHKRLLSGFPPVNWALETALDENTSD